MIHVFDTYSMTTEANLHFTSKPYVNHLGSSVSRPVSRTHNSKCETSALLKQTWPVEPSDIDVFITNAAWAIRSTYHTVLKTSPGAAIFGRDMLFDIPFLANWNKIGEHRQRQTDRNTEQENRSRHVWDHKLLIKYFLEKMVSSAKVKRWYESDPWTITSVHTNGTIRFQ